MLGAMRLRPTLVAIVTCLGWRPAAARRTADEHRAAPHVHAGDRVEQLRRGAATDHGKRQRRAATAATTTSDQRPARGPQGQEAEAPETGAPRGLPGRPRGDEHHDHRQGDVSPPVVSVPSGVGVELHVTNHGSATAHGRAERARTSERPRRPRRQRHPRDRGPEGRDLPHPRQRDPARTAHDRRPGRPVAGAPLRAFSRSASPARRRGRAAAARRRARRRARPAPAPRRRTARSGGAGS